MTTIHTIGNMSIQKIKGDTYQLNIINNQPAFWLSFPWEIIDIIRPQQNPDNKDEISVTFRANSVQTLPQFIARRKERIFYEDAMKFFFNMKAQLEALEKQDLTIAAFDLDDIIVLNDEQYIYVNQEKIVKRINHEQFELVHPIKKNRFLPAELKNASLPAKLPYQTSFYSLGAVITFSLTNDTQDNYIKALESIEQTPLYWALLRCLEPNPKERFLLMI
jgi:hypothetical protein